MIEKSSFKSKRVVSCDCEDLLFLQTEEENMLFFALVMSYSIWLFMVCLELWHIRKVLEEIKKKMK